MKTSDIYSPARSGFALKYVATGRHPPYGKIRALAITSAKRYSFALDIPTVAENVRS